MFHRPYQSDNASIEKYIRKIEKMCRYGKETMHKFKICKVEKYIMVTHNFWATLMLQMNPEVRTTPRTFVLCKYLPSCTK